MRDELNSEPEFFDDRDGKERLETDIKLIDLELDRVLQSELHSGGRSALFVLLERECVDGNNASTDGDMLEDKMLLSELFELHVETIDDFEMMSGVLSEIFDLVMEDISEIEELNVDSEIRSGQVLFKVGPEGESELLDKIENVVLMLDMEVDMQGRTELGRAILDCEILGIGIEIFPLIFFMEFRSEVEVVEV